MTEAEMSLLKVRTPPSVDVPKVVMVRPGKGTIAAQFDQDNDEEPAFGKKKGKRPLHDDEDDEE